jgi:hypothetical protein
MSGYRRPTERATERRRSASDLLVLARRNELADSGRLVQCDRSE